jgi:hypothetical protein
MKKLFVTLVFLAVSLIGNAQFFVAGSISASYYSNSTTYESSVIGNPTVNSGFSVTPAVGYMIPGKSYGFGLGLGYGYLSSKIDNVSYVGGYKKTCTNSFDFGPFFRYAYAKFDKITLYVDAKVPVSIGKTNVCRDGGVIVVEPGSNTFSIGGRLIPGLTYKFNSHILFTTEIGLLSLNYIHTRVSSSSGAVDVTNDFKLGANTRQTAAFGFVYLF